jgi:predicted acylesterase/phospholipase RssA
MPLRVGQALETERLRVLPGIVEAVPGILAPVGIEGADYEDGDELLPLAVRAARQAGAAFVIAVDVTPRLETTPSDAAGLARRDILAGTGR